MTSTSMDANLALIEPPTPLVRSAHHGGAFFGRHMHMSQSPSINLTSPCDQVQHLIDRGMTIHDRAAAARSLTHIGFQRLSSYWRSFESSTPSQQGNLFVDGARFHTALSRYLFDQRLRSHLLEAFSFIEVSIRTQWARQLAYAHGEDAHQDATLFNGHHSNNLKELQRSYGQITSQESTSFHQRPIWDVIHAMTFGQLSKWFASLGDRRIRQSISQNYGMDESILVSALQYLTRVRNICAHHDRLWDLNVATGLKIPNTLGNDLEAAKAFNKQALGKVYNAIVLITHLMEVITPHGDWPERLLELNGAYPSVSEADMGFPANWENNPMWRRHVQASE